MEEIVADYPSLTEEDVRSVIAFAAVTGVAALRSHTGERAPMLPIFSPD